MIDYVKVLLRNPNNPQSPKKTYAQAQSRETVELDALVDHMADHGTPFSRGTIKAVLTDAVTHIEELLLDGRIVKLAELGTFSVSLRCTGVCESMIDRQTGLKPVFTANNITAVKVNWRPSKELTNLRDRATFQEVQTRKAQAADLKEKHGQIADGTYKGDGKNNDGGSNEVE